MHIGRLGVLETEHKIRLDMWVELLFKAWRKAIAATVRVFVFVCVSEWEVSACLLCKCVKATSSVCFGGLVARECLCKCSSGQVWMQQECRLCQCMLKQPHPCTLCTQLEMRALAAKYHQCKRRKKQRKAREGKLRESLMGMEVEEDEQDDESESPEVRGGVCVRRTWVEKVGYG